jgi:hypothetical protein
MERDVRDRRDINASFTLSAHSMHERAIHAVEGTFEHAIVRVHVFLVHVVIGEARCLRGIFRDEDFQVGTGT